MKSVFFWKWSNIGLGTQATTHNQVSISTRILGPDPTTSEANRIHPIVDPTKFGKVLETPIYGHGDHNAKIVITSGDFPT